MKKMKKRMKRKMVKKTAKRTSSRFHDVIVSATDCGRSWCIDIDSVVVEYS